MDDFREYTDEAIIDQETFDNVQRIRAKRQALPGRLWARPIP